LHDVTAPKSSNGSTIMGERGDGEYLVPGTPLGGEHTAAEIRQIVTNLH
jgi:hypothetical protein